MTATKVKQLRDIIECFYSVRYATTTRSLARYSSYSRRSLFRFLKGDYPWVAIRLSLLKAFIFQEGQHFIAAADEVVEGKSGKLSHGLSRFYSSIAGKPIAGVCFFGLSFIEVNKRNSYFMGAQQVVYSQEDKQRIAENKTKRKAAKQRVAQGIALPKGRKKGSPNQPKQQNTTASFRAFQHLWQETMSLLKECLPLLRLTHLVADSAYGTLDYLKAGSEIWPAPGFSFSQQRCSLSTLPRALQWKRPQASLWREVETHRHRCCLFESKQTRGKLSL